MQLVPNAENTLAGIGANTVDALAALLDKIGPAVVIVHSQSGLLRTGPRAQAPEPREGLVTVEGGCDEFSANDAQILFRQSADAVAVGRQQRRREGHVNGDDRRNGCLAAVNAIKAAGGRATFYVLPEHGIKGNSHMMMMDKNNLQSPTCC